MQEEAFAYNPFEKGVVVNTLDFLNEDLDNKDNITRALRVFVAKNKYCNAGMFLASLPVNDLLRVYSMLLTNDPDLYRLILSLRFAEGYSDAVMPAEDLDIMVKNFKAVLAILFILVNARQIKYKEFDKLSILDGICTYPDGTRQPSVKFNNGYKLSDYHDKDTQTVTTMLIKGYLT